MKRKILIEKSKNKIRTYLIEDDDIVEIHTSINEEQVPPGKLGDIYIGKVQNIVQNIGAAFIEITKGVNCYFDLKDAENAYFTHKSGKKPLCIGDELVVQISREAVKTKAPTVTSHLSFTGRYAVLTHGNTRIGVSSKIPRALRDEFKDRLSRMKNEQFGIIIRTNAKGVPFQEVEDEIERLKEEYKKLFDTIKEKVQNVSITTDIIVGFPNETEEDFQKTLDIVNYCKFDGAFTFIFSPRVGTAAALMEDKTSLEEKEERLQKLNKLVNEYSLESNKKYVDKEKRKELIKFVVIRKL